MTKKSRKIHVVAEASDKAMIRMADHSTPLSLFSAAPGTGISIQDWRTSFTSITRSILMDMREQAKKAVDDLAVEIAELDAKLKTIHEDEMRTFYPGLSVRADALADSLSSWLGKSVAYRFGSNESRPYYGFCLDCKPEHDKAVVDKEQRVVMFSIRFYEKDTNNYFDEVEKKFTEPLPTKFCDLIDVLEQKDREIKDARQVLADINWQLCNLTHNADRFHSALTLAYARGKLVSNEDVIRILRSCIQSVLKLDDDSPLLKNSAMFISLDSE